MLTRTGYLLVVLLYLAQLQASAQQWSLDQDSGAKVSVTGTSTLSDWEVICPDVTGIPAQLTLDPDQPEPIGEFGFKVLVETMDGGRGASMNDKVKTALQSTDHPYVEYRQTQPASVSKASAPGTFNVSSQGTLSMAGTDKSVSVECTIAVDNEVLVVSGSKSLKFSEFNMTPPSAMFGQIKTNDDVVVNYEFRYLKQ